MKHLIFISLLLVAINVIAEEHFPPPLLVALEKIELSDKTKQQIATTLEIEREKGHQLMGELHEYRVALSYEIRNHDATEESVRKAARALSKVEEELAVAIHGTGLKILSLLTPEERKKLKEVRLESEEELAASSSETIGERVEKWIEKYGTKKKSK